MSDHQLLQYKKRRQTQTQVAAAAGVGISERSARRVEVGRGLPSQEPQRHWRTRRDPLEGVWESDLLPLLEASPHLSATTLFEELVRRQPGNDSPGQVRAIQRRVRAWRALHGADRAVFFAQERPPGRQGLSDFTVADKLGVTIDGVAFTHRLYQFAIAHSGSPSQIQACGFPAPGSSPGLAQRRCRSPKMHDTRLRNLSSDLVPGYWVT